MAVMAMTAVIMWRILAITMIQHTARTFQDQVLVILREFLLIEEQRGVIGPELIVLVLVLSQEIRFLLRHSIEIFAIEILSEGIGQEHEHILDLLVVGQQRQSLLVTGRDIDQFRLAAITGTILQDQRARGGRLEAGRMLLGLGRVCRLLGGCSFASSQSSVIFLVGEFLRILLRDRGLW